MRGFAERTKVPVERSRMEIERLIVRHGATQFESGWRPGGAAIRFRIKDRFVRFELDLPDETSSIFTKARGDKKATLAAEHRRLWRAMALVIKAKLEAVESGICSFDQEFLAHIIVPSGETFGEVAIPQLAEAYKRGVMMPPLLKATT